MPGTGRIRAREEWRSCLLTPHMQVWSSPREALPHTCFISTQRLPRSAGKFDRTPGTLVSISVGPSPLPNNSLTHILLALTFQQPINYPQVLTARLEHSLSRRQPQSDQADFIVPTSRNIHKVDKTAAPISKSKAMKLHGKANPHSCKPCNS